MDWDDLRVFLAVAASGQIARAAQALAIDPTTVGRRLRRLEAALGQALFEQQRDGQKLTEAGEALLARAEAMARLADGIAGDADGADREPGGLLRLSVSEGFGIWFVAHHLPAFATACPGVRVDLVATSGFLNPSRRETDVAVLLARPRRGPLVTRKLTDYRLGLYAAPRYLAGREPVRAPADLRGHQLVGYIPDLVYAPELHYLDEVHPRLEPRLRSSSINAQHALVQAGAGIAVLPCFIGGADPGLRRVLPALAITRSFWLTTHQDTRNLPRIRRFTDWLTALAAAEAERLLGA